MNKCTPEHKVMFATKVMNHIELLNAAIVTIFV